jgi:hypothetical protein
MLFMELELEHIVPVNHSCDQYQQTTGTAVMVVLNTAEILKLCACDCLGDGNRFSCRNVVSMCVVVCVLVCVWLCVYGFVFVCVCVSVKHGWYEPLHTLVTNQRSVPYLTGTQPDPLCCCRQQAALCSGVPSNFFGGRGVQQILLRTDGREIGDLGAVAP